MKRYQIILTVIFTLIGALWIVGRVTNALQYYKTASGSNEPTFKPGYFFFASNLITPKRFDFICYIGTDPTEPKPSMFVHRLCGLPGDTIEIKDGDLFVNGVNEDRSLNLKKLYRMPRQVAVTVDFKDDEYVLPIDNTDSAIGPLETIKQADLIKKAIRFTSLNDDYIKNLYGQPWTVDRFGPYIVPADTYFVLGDNRNMSQDSRYAGPIEKKKFIATVIK